MDRICSFGKLRFWKVDGAASLEVALVAVVIEAEIIRTANEVHILLLQLLMKVNIAGTIGAMVIKQISVTNPVPIKSRKTTMPTIKSGAIVWRDLQKSPYLCDR